ncbi:MAG: hypothetical protein IKT40_08325 [Bacilli bacterium]|nr:hypothetical protein [Bacilli bacterium]
MEILSNYELTSNDHHFIMYINNYIVCFPFKWHHFMSVIESKEIVYVKDTTLIINLLKLDSSSIIIVFEIFKDFLRNNIIKKINYKKEVIIIEFHNDFMISFFKHRNKWMLLGLIEILEDNQINYYLDVYIKSNNEITKYDCLFMYDDYLISIGNKKYNELHDKHIHLTLNFYNNENCNLKYSFDKGKYFSNLLGHLRVK